MKFTVSLAWPALFPLFVSCRAASDMYCVKQLAKPQRRDRGTIELYRGEETNTLKRGFAYYARVLSHNSRRFEFFVSSLGARVKRVTTTLHLPHPHRPFQVIGVPLLAAQHIRTCLFFPIRLVGSVETQRCNVSIRDLHF